MINIVERLRSVGGIEGTTRWYINPDGPEAAAEIERLRENLSLAYDVCESCKAEIERLREIVANLLGQLHGYPIKHPQQAKWRDAARAALKGDE